MRESFQDFIKNKLPGEFVLIACGLPVTGKTGATREVAGTTGYPLLRTDLIRQELLKGEDIFDQRVAANMAKRMMVYDEMFRRAEETLKTEKSVILDATFITQELRKRAAGIAAGHKLPFIILETVCPEEVALCRLQGRTRENYESNALTEAAYRNNKKMFEEVDIDDLKSAYPGLDIVHLTIDTSDNTPQDWYVTGVSK